MLLATPLQRVALVGFVAMAIPARAAADDTEACISASEHGQALAREHKLVAAREQFVACARDVCPAPILRDCAAKLATVEAGVATMVLVAQDYAGQTMTHVRVAMDGVPLATELDGKALEVDPGMHRFRFETTARAPVDRE